MKTSCCNTTIRLCFSLSFCSPVSRLFSCGCFSLSFVPENGCLKVCRSLSRIEKLVLHLFVSFFLFRTFFFLFFLCFVKTHSCGLQSCESKSCVQYNKNQNKRRYKVTRRARFLCITFFLRDFYLTFYCSSLVLFAVFDRCCMVCCVFDASLFKLFAFLLMFLSSLFLILSFTHTPKSLFFTVIPFVVTKPASHASQA